MLKLLSYPKLFKKDSKGKIRYWNQELLERKDCTVIRCTSGIEGSKPIINDKSIDSSSVKHHWDRATALAYTKWENKRDSGYCLTTEEAIAWVPRRPMLSKTAYINEPETIEPLLPCLGQVKLDGIRAMWYPDSLTLESRKGKPWDRVDHITEVLRSKADDIHLDGELYCLGMPLQDIVHWVRTMDTSGKHRIQYFVFDSPSKDPKESYAGRLLRLKKWYESLDDAVKDIIVILPLVHLESYDQVKEHFDTVVGAKYEGIMLKDYKAPYFWDKRVKASVKVKPVFSEEFPIVRSLVNSSTGTGLIEFVCKTKECKEFKVVPRWSKRQRAESTKCLQSFIGKQLTVEFRGWTKDRLPVHGVGVAIRNYE